MNPIYQPDALVILTTTDWLAEELTQPRRARLVRKDALKFRCGAEELIEALRLLCVEFVVRDGEVWWQLPGEVTGAVPRPTLRAVQN